MTLRSASLLILGFIIVSNIWIECVVEAKQGLTDRFTCPNHWLQHRNRDSSYHRTHRSLDGDFGKSGLGDEYDLLTSLLDLS